MSGRRAAHPAATGVGVALCLAATSAALGAGAILLSRAGTGDRPAIAVPVLALAVLAALVPLEYGLPVALTLASFAGLFKYFVGDGSLYWNEIFVLLIVGRSLLSRRPSRLDVGVLSLVAAGCLGYLVAGVELRSIAWGMKVLLTSAALLWALSRLEVGRRAWRATYIGLVLAVSPNVALAGWQRAQGAVSLRSLGLPERAVPETASGGLRAFGGFTSHAAFSYACVIALVVWLAFAFAGRREERSLALVTAWLPVAALLGLAWSHDRTALVALVFALAAIGILGFRSRRYRLLAAGGGATAALAIALVALLASTSLVADAFSPRSSTAKMRIAQARDYLAQATLFGAGPGSAGSAYERVAGPYRPPVDLSGAWGRAITNGYSRSLFLTSGSRITIRPGAVTGRRAVIAAEARSSGLPRRLVARSLESRRQVGSWQLSPGHTTVVTVPIPLVGAKPGVEFSVSPDAAPFAVELRSARIDGLDDLNAAERVAARQLFQGEPPGVVDNLYVSWIFQFGILAVLPIVVWLALALWLLVVRLEARSLEVAARGLGAFLVVGALTVNLWEEFPTDFIVAVIAAQAVASSQRGWPRTPGALRFERADSRSHGRQ